MYFHKELIIIRSGTTHLLSPSREVNRQIERVKVKFSSNPATSCGLPQTTRTQVDSVRPVGSGVKLPVDLFDLFYPFFEISEVEHAGDVLHFHNLTDSVVTASNTV